MNGRSFRAAPPCGAAFALIAAASGPAHRRSRRPTSSLRRQDRQPTVKAGRPATRQMVVAANPVAAEAGLEVLRAGGNAADALVAVQTVLGLVEPQSSGLGGGAFLVWYDGKTGEMTTFDGRETAPAAATPDLFLGADGKPLEFFDAVVGGRSVGVPGVPRLLETIHRRYGTRPWQSLFEPAIRLADQGFAVSPRLAALVADEGEKLDEDPGARAYFFAADGSPLPAGHVLRNPDYATTLRTVATDGADAFYNGPIAAKIVETVRSHPTNPGLLTLDDMAVYKVKERPAVCAPYRGHEVCGMGPPSSGAIAIGQILGLLEPFDIATLGAGRSGSLAADRRRHPPRLRRPRALCRRQRFRLDARGPARPRLSQVALRIAPPSDGAGRRRSQGRRTGMAARPNSASTASPSKCRRHRISSSSMPPAISPR